MKNATSAERSGNAIPLKPNRGFVRLKVEEVLMPIFVRGRLSKNEAQIVWWVIGNSWRWSGRQTTRDAVSLSQIAADTGIPLSHVSRTWKDLTARGIIVEHPAQGGNGFRASFNEHMETWTGIRTGGVTKLVTKSYQIGNKELPNWSLPPSESQRQQSVADPLRNRRNKILAATPPSNSKDTSGKSGNRYGRELRAVTQLWNRRFPRHRLRLPEYGKIRAECERHGVSPSLLVNRIPSDHLTPWKYACGFFADNYPWPEPDGPDKQGQTFFGWQQSLDGNGAGA